MKMPTILLQGEWIKQMDERMTNEETEVDLLELFFILKRKWWMILLAGAAGFAIATAFSIFATAKGSYFASV